MQPGTASNCMVRKESARFYSHHGRYQVEPGLYPVKPIVGQCLRCNYTLALSFTCCFTFDFALLLLQIKDLGLMVTLVHTLYTIVGQDLCTGQSLNPTQ